ncbi:hypothetical protein [Actinoplanes couchii]|uniref:Uncharacterized protein n=1 Tax=Actinoplanes couchii TaxID=403638 RepID=A0ABQ3XLY0_9ACTN|nr:hypothetical protein [Actinoplanes couchii]MDR6319295.1 hypothetical protein [Actinoplanes couchii]GID59496.1 hypothetical protein Aco03nite_079000 [Actinoplanes couchii]
MTRFPIARYLLLNHTPFLAMCLGGLALFGAVALGVTAALTTVTLSVADIGGQILHWLAFGYGFSAAGVLSTMIVHGRTRREFITQHAVFQVITAGLLALLVTGVYAAEAGVYRLAGWERRLQEHHVFGAGDYPMIFVAYWSMLAIALMIGAFVGVAFLRGDAAILWALLAAVVLVLAAGGVNGFFSLGFNRLDLESLPLTAGLSVPLFVAGWAALWLAARDVAVRTKVPA